MCAYAARHDALGVNPVRETSPISVKPKKGAPKAMSIVQIRQLRALMTYDPKAVELDLPDIVGMLAASGLRIGECLAIVWDAIDFEARTVEVRGTVIRIKGNGLIIKPAPKSEAGWRNLVLPKWCIELLEHRLDEREHVQRLVHRLSVHSRHAARTDRRRQAAQACIRASRFPEDHKSLVEEVSRHGDG